MKFDSYGLIVMERDGMPADLGDSCHETARYLILKRNNEVSFEALSSCVSGYGFLRHPDAPAADAVGDSWRESDATSDMVLPLLMALDQIVWSGLLGLEQAKMAKALADNIRVRLKSTWTVAPGRIASPALMALVYERLELFRRLTAAQRIIFSLGWRWSDDKSLEGKWWKLVRSNGAPSDYLNWACSIVYLKTRGYNIDHDPALIIKKVSEYYESQPGSSWVVDAYKQNFETFRLASSDPSKDTLEKI